MFFERFGTRTFFTFILRVDGSTVLAGAHDPILPVLVSEAASGVSEAASGVSEAASGVSEAASHVSEAASRQKGRGC